MNQLSPILISVVRFLVCLLFAVTCIIAGVHSSGQTTLSPPAFYGTSGPAPYFIQTADLDGDGNIDIVTGSLSLPGSGISILYGNGDGTVTQTDPNVPTIATGPGTYGIKVADLNNDGAPDIVVSHIGPSSSLDMTILINQGNRHFSAKPYKLIVSGNGGPASVDVADFNGDGRVDIITNSYGYFAPNYEFGVLSIYLQDENGEFGSVFAGDPGLRIGRDSYAGARAEFFTLGDVNNDGYLDAVVSNNHAAGYSMSVLLGDGHGNLTRTAVFGHSCEVGGIVMGDLNGDHNLDVVQMSFGDGGVSVFYGDGQGSFTTSAYNIGTTSVNPAIADMNNDTFPDIVVPGTGGGDQITILYGSQDGSFPTSQTFANAGGPVSVQAIDMNGDGKLDIVASDSKDVGLIGYSGSVSVQLNTSSADITAPTTGYLLSDQPNAAGWHCMDVRIELAAADEAGGSGVRDISYTMSGAQSGAVTATGSAASLLVSAEGETVVTFYASDNAGNVEAPLKTLTIRIDKTAPSTDCQMAFSGANTTVTLTATDPILGAAHTVSGVAQTFYKVDGGLTQAYSAPFQVAWSGSHTVEFWSVDAAGNEELPHQTKPVKSTATVVVKLVDSAGNPLAGGKAQYYLGSWHDIGVTGSDGTVSIELAPATYAFSVDYGGGRTQKNQNITSDTIVSFQTIHAVVQLRDSTGNPLSGGKAQYYAGSWRDIGMTGSDGTIGVELPAGTYAFSIDYNGSRTQKNQNISADPNVVFQTIHTVVKLRDSAGNPLSGGKAQVYAGSWRDIGLTGTDGTAGIELLAGTYAFSIDFNGSRTQKNQNIASDPIIVFQTTRAVVRLIDSAGLPLSGGKAQYYAGSWRDIGLTGADGTVSVELAAGTYAFSIDYAGGRTQKNQTVGPGSEALFQTGRVHSASGSCAQYYASSWIAFTNDMELLPIAIVFKFSDGTPNTTVTVVAGVVTTIH